MTDDSSSDAPTPDAELVCVLATGDAALIPFVKSLLDAEAIEYFVRGEAVQDLLGWGRMPAGFNVVTGPAEFWVRAEDAERATDLLRDITTSDSDSQSPSDAE